MDGTLLIVDDEPELRRMLERRFSRSPYRVLTAGSALEALQILRRVHVDVVLTDASMPQVDGTELLSIVRKKYPSVVRMMLTAFPADGMAGCVVRKVEFHGFFTKPCPHEKLAAAIAKALEERAQQAALVPDEG